MPRTPDRPASTTRPVYGSSKSPSPTAHGVVASEVDPCKSRARTSSRVVHPFPEPGAPVESLQAGPNTQADAPEQSRSYPGTFTRFSTTSTASRSGATRLRPGLPGAGFWRAPGHRRTPEITSTTTINTRARGATGGSCRPMCANLRRGGGLNVTVASMRWRPRLPGQTVCSCPVPVEAHGGCGQHRPDPKSDLRAYMWT